MTMNRLIKLKFGLIAIFILSACSSQSEKQSTSNEDQQIISNVAADMDNQVALYENGLGEKQIERYKMVVLPTQVNLSNQDQLPISSDLLSETITHEIATALHNSQRFEILANKHSNDSLSNESSEVDSNGITQSEFYLKSKLTQLDTDETVRILKATGQGVEEKQVSTTVLYQIIDAKTNKIVLGRSLRYQLKSTTNSESLSTTINNTFAKIADLMKREVLNEIYPIRILKADNNQIILDQPLPVDTECDVIRIGEKLKDGYTNSVLGYEQTQVGKLAVTNVTSVLSYGKIIDGQVSEGDICKIGQAKSLVASELVIRTERGGVILPFD